jgi:hypothetical protein
VGHIAQIEKVRTIRRILVRETETRRLLVDLVLDERKQNEMELKVIYCEILDWIHAGQDGVRLLAN